jgi:hypothetical protein
MKDKKKLLFIQNINRGKSGRTPFQGYGERHGKHGELATTKKLIP